MTDPIADMLTRIRNTQMAKKSEVVVPYSKIKFGIAQILEKEGYIEKAEKVENQFSEILISLKYEAKGDPKIKELKRVSKVGCRVYVGRDEIKKILNGFGISILSTSKGLLTNDSARKAGVVGEVICEIY